MSSVPWRSACRSAPGGRGCSCGFFLSPALLFESIRNCCSSPVEPSSSAPRDDQRAARSRRGRCRRSRSCRGGQLGRPIVGTGLRGAGAGRSPSAAGSLRSDGRGVSVPARACRSPAQCTWRTQAAPVRRWPRVDATPPSRGKDAPSMTDQPGSDDAGRGSSPSGDPASPLDFDPYRYGKPEHPIPPEYAPPGYVPPAAERAAAADPAGVAAAGGARHAAVSAAARLPLRRLPAARSSRTAATPRIRRPRRAIPPTGRCSRATARRPRRWCSASSRIVFFWLTVLDLALAVPAIIVGALALRDANRVPRRGRGAARRWPG